MVMGPGRVKRSIFKDSRSLDLIINFTNGVSSRHSDIEVGCRFQGITLCVCVRKCLIKTSNETANFNKDSSILK